MNFVTAHIKWIMLVSGALTCTMAYALFAPQAALLSTFGETLEGPVAEIVVRNWGALITLVGAMLIYGAFNPHIRAPVLTMAGASKAIFIVLVLWQGTSFLSQQAGIAILIDLLWVVLFTWFLLSARTRPADSN